VSALGIATGGLVHIAAVTLGVSSIVLSSAEAFTVVKLAGAAYLVFLGVRTLLTRPTERVDGPTRRRPWQIYRQGVVVNVLNPKTALFFLAFLPQFVDAEAGHVPLQLALLGTIFVFLALLSDSSWALVTGTAADWLRNRRWFLSVQRYVSGCVFIGLGALAAFSGERAHAR
jgi:threonine/homoserine/homoserine lactone efflux protein